MISLILDAEERTRLVQYRNNLIIYLMEMKGYKFKTKQPKEKNIPVKLTHEKEAKILFEIYCLSVLAEYDTRPKYNKKEALAAIQADIESFKNDVKKNK